MRLLLVNTVTPGKKIESLFPPLGLGYLASYLRKKFPGVKIKVVSRALEEHIRTFRPNLVGISSVTQNFSLAKRYAQVAKDYNLPVIVGGTHISLLPSSLGKEMDLGVVGEGEDTLAEIIAVFRESGLDFGKMEKIRGLLYHSKDGSIAFTGPRDLIRPLDRILFPARDLLGIKKGERCYIFSSRGCPYRCVFCASSRFWQKVRFFSAPYVVRELEEILMNYQPIHITFYDDLFIFQKERLKQIVKLVKERGLQERVEFSVSARANLIDQVMASLLREMNVTAVNMGLEAASSRILNYLKPTVTLEENKNAVKILNAHNIAVNASFIIGSPLEEKEEIIQTLKFIENNTFNLVEVYLLTPYPGTPLWEYALDRRLVTEDMDWKRLSLDVDGNSSYIHLSETLTREELYQLYRRFQILAKKKRFFALIQKAYRNPRRIIPYLKREMASRRRNQ